MKLTFLLLKCFIANYHNLFHELMTVSWVHLEIQFQSLNPNMQGRNTSPFSTELFE